MVERSERYVCPYEPFQAGEDFETFLKRTARRDNYLRRRKWLEKQEGYRIERSVKPAELARPMAEFFRLHALRWEGDGGSQGIKGPGVESFHREAVELLAERGVLRLYTMWLGETAVAEDVIASPPTGRGWPVIADQACFRPPRMASRMGREPWTATRCE